MQFSAADIAALLDTFGQSAEIGIFIGIKSYTVVFDSPGQIANIFTGQIETSAPSVIIADSDLAECEATHGTVVETGGVRYSIIAIDPDGTGFTRLSLTRDFP